MNAHGAEDGSFALLLVDVSSYFSAYDGPFDHYCNGRVNLVPFYFRL